MAFVRLGSLHHDNSNVMTTGVKERRFAQALFSPLPGRYDRLASWLSLGQNARWRRTMVDAVLGTMTETTGIAQPPAAQSSPRSSAGQPVVVADIAAGTAGVAIQLAQRTDAQVIAVDVTESMLREGLRRIAASGYESRILAVVADGSHLPFVADSFDGLTFGYLLRYVADPASALSELTRVVKPGRALASLDFYVPPTTLWHGAWWLYTRLVLPVAGLLTGGRQWFRVGRFLGPNISSHYRRYPLDWMVAAWRGAGCHSVGSKVMSLGGGLVMWGTKDDA